MPALKVPSLGGRGFSSREVVKQVLKVVKQDLGFIAVYLLYLCVSLCLLMYIHSCCVAVPFTCIGVCVGCVFE